MSPHESSVFSRGRKDCQPKDSQNSKFLYLTQKREAHPAMGFNGKMTVDYFKKNFDFSPREALALMDNLADWIMLG